MLNATRLLGGSSIQIGEPRVGRVSDMKKLIESNVFKFEAINAILGTEIRVEKALVTMILVLWIPGKSILSIDYIYGPALV